MLLLLRHASRAILKALRLRQASLALRPASLAMLLCQPTLAVNTPLALEQEQQRYWHLSKLSLIPLMRW